MMYLLESALSLREDSLPRPSPGALVEADWLACLSKDKLQTFNAYTEVLEARYLLLSVSLNRAIDLRDEARAESQRLLVAIPALCDLFAKHLQDVLSSMEQHTKLNKVNPNAAPLDPANFRRPFDRRAAGSAGLFSKFLLSRRARFLRKAKTLREMIGHIGRDLCNATNAITGGTNAGTSFHWESMNTNHYDLNTCFRETTILLKCFLHAMPEGQLTRFRQSVEIRVANNSALSRSASAGS
jgi:hypothetical protein